MNRPLIKICGLTRAKDFALCNHLEIDFTGMIFVEKSPRYLAPSRAAKLPAGKSLRVGVFAQADPKEINETARLAGLDFIQLHGGETPEFCQRIGPERIIKVLWPQRHSSANLAEEMEKFAPVCSYFLFDSGKSGGGSGQSMSWTCLQHIEPPRPWLLAGGLGPENITEALGACHPSGVDMNSALEDMPGIKNHERIRQALVLIQTYSKLTEKVS